MTGPRVGSHTGDGVGARVGARGYTCLIAALGPASTLAVALGIIVVAVVVAVIKVHHVVVVLELVDVAVLEGGERVDLSSLVS